MRSSHQGCLDLTPYVSYLAIIQPFEMLGLVIPTRERNTKVPGYWRDYEGLEIGKSLGLPAKEQAWKHLETSEDENCEVFWQRALDSLRYSTDSSTVAAHFSGAFHCSSTNLSFGATHGATQAASKKKFHFFRQNLAGAQAELWSFVDPSDPSEER